jgi:methyltransferase (TIGR00027 family)
VTESEHLIRNISDTALWVAAYRAVESERPDALFRDPFARKLAGERGAAIARKLSPHMGGWWMAVRTALIDEMIAAAVQRDGFDMVVNLAAGLDTRPFRLDVPADLRWVEVDLPDLLAYKESLIGSEQPRCRLERIRLDLANVEARRQLFDRLNAEGRRVLVLTEGLLVYLSPEQVGELARDLHGQPHFQRWVMDVVGAQMILWRGRWTQELKWANAEFKFAPEEGTAFFEPFGWQEAEYHDLIISAERFNRDPWSLKVMRFLVRLAPSAQQRPFRRLIGIARFDRLDQAEASA